MATTSSQPLPSLAELTTTRGLFRAAFIMQGGRLWRAPQRQRKARAGKQPAAPAVRRSPGTSCRPHRRCMVYPRHTASRRCVVRRTRRTAARPLHLGLGLCFGLGHFFGLRQRLNGRNQVLAQVGSPIERLAGSTRRPVRRRRGDCDGCHRHNGHRCNPRESNGSATDRHGHGRVPLRNWCRSAPNPKRTNPCFEAFRRDPPDGKRSETECMHTLGAGLHRRCFA
jgi:hypothetical protein